MGLRNQSCKTRTLATITIAITYYYYHYYHHYFYLPTIFTYMPFTTFQLPLLADLPLTTTIQRQDLNFGKSQSDAASRYSPRFARPATRG